MEGSNEQLGVKSPIVDSVGKIGEVVGRNVDQILLRKEQKLKKV